MNIWHESLVESCKAQDDYEACLDRGTRWSTLFIANGIFSVFLGVSFLFVFVFMVWPTRARPWPWMISILCNCLLGAWLNMAALIIVAMLRFSEVGSVCAESDLKNYKQDGNLILAVWSSQLFLYPCMCCLGLCSFHSSIQQRNRLQTVKTNNQIKDSRA